MTSERIQRRIDSLLDEADEALARLEWTVVRDRATAVLALDASNADARTYLETAERQLGSVADAAATSSPSSSPEVSQPTSFANGRYEVSSFLGEGGKKRVYLAHDAQLDRDVAFALIKTEGLDEAARTRITREAQAMGRLGSHPHIVTVYDIGEENDQPYLVLPVLPGGDVEGVIEDAPDHKLSIEQAVKIASETCMGLEFCHSKGIIHRDLKPGNVWLAEDGRAMIGDFGLAVAVDRSRLTQAGMMVGTVNYMPPEQAMGGEVTPQSDLYSLGAMLYEMVCGRPPFVGDESVAIIGQHLNTPPVAPTWHRPDCPPGLEALILRLLEKDPERRPASATEAREALQAVTPSTASDPSVQQPTEQRGADPLYRRVFVGRETELRQLQQAYDAAVSGQGGLVMVVGEPGIGKTALCEQLATYAAMRGGRWLVGHCYEEGSLSLPYLAFVEAMRTYVLDRDPEVLRSELGSGAAEVARIVSEVRDKVQVELPDAGSPDDDRWRLLTSITTFLRNAANVQPLVIVLEDLHWADRGTLDLLQHVSRNLEGARLVIIGTYRDVEVDRTHPLSATLGELRRVGTFTRIPLRGLTVDEVHRMYEAIRGQATPWGQAEAVHRQTEGNPLFVQEVLRYLVEEGIVVREDGRYVPQAGEGAGIPEGLRDVVGRRLSRLSNKTNQVLAIAAVMGREFRLDVLQRVADLPEEEIYSALEEAVERAVIEERSGVGAAVAYRFAHAFFRQTLYEETIAPRRIRLHQQVARALEAVYGNRLEEHAAELAEHYSYSSTPEDLKKAVEYGELAAARATNVFDYGEAERHLEQALKVQEVLDPDDKMKRCDLLLRMGNVLLPAGGARRAVDDIAAEAFNIADSIVDSKRALAACFIALDGLNRIWSGLTGFSPDFRIWTERAAKLAPPMSSERARADTALGLLRGARTREGVALLWRGLDVARAAGDKETFFYCAGHLLARAVFQDDLERRVQLITELTSTSSDEVSARSRGISLWWGGLTLLMIGERSKTEELWEQVRDIARVSSDRTASFYPLIDAAVRLFLDGYLSEARDAIDDALVRADEAGFRLFVLSFLNGLRQRTSLYLGDDPQVIANQGIDQDLVPPGQSARVTPRWYALHALLALTQAGREEEARDAYRTFKLSYQPQDWAILPALEACCHLEAAVSQGDIEVMESVHSFLIAAPRFVTPNGLNQLTNATRLLGLAARGIGKQEQARAHFEQALAEAAGMRFRPELALTRLGLAELLLDHYPDEHDAAIEHLDFAIAEFRDMKMQPALERALGRRGLLKA